MNFLIMTCKDNKPLTQDCLETLGRTIDREAIIFVVDATNIWNAQVSTDEIEFWTRGQEFIKSVFVKHVDCGITEGWNIGIEMVLSYLKDNSLSTEQDVWLMNNDIVFFKTGWLSALQDHLHNASYTAEVGTTMQSVHGIPFASGGIWGFKLVSALAAAENGKVLDERFNFSFQDVDLSYRFINILGMQVTHVHGVELGTDPMVRHLVSQTTGTSVEATQTRKREEDMFLEKWHING